MYIKIYFEWTIIDNLEKFNVYRTSGSGSTQSSNNMPDNNIKQLRYL